MATTATNSATAWVSVEVNDCLLSGEFVGGRWEFHCDDMPEFARRFTGAHWPFKAIQAFFYESWRRKLELEKSQRA